MACDVCRKVLLHETDYLEGAGDDNTFVFAHHLDASSLRSSAKVTKCPFCSDLWQQLTAQQQQAMLEKYGTREQSIAIPCVTYAGIMPGISDDKSPGTWTYCLRVHDDVDADMPTQKDDVASSLFVLQTKEGEFE